MTTLIDNNDFFFLGFDKQFSFNLFHANVPPHVETSKLICIANKFTGFYMRGKIGMKKFKYNT